MILYNLVIFLLISQVVAGKRCAKFSGYYNESKFKKLEKETKMKEIAISDSAGKTSGDDDNTSYKQNHQALGSQADFMVDTKNFLMTETLGRDSSVCVLTKREVKNWIGKIDVKRKNFFPGDPENFIHLVYLFPLGDYSSDDIKTKWKKVSGLKLFNDKLDHFLFDMKMCQVNPVGYFVVKINESKNDLNYTKNDVKEVKDSEKEGTDGEIGRKIWNSRSKREVFESINVSDIKNINDETNNNTTKINESENEIDMTFYGKVIFVTIVAVLLLVALLLVWTYFYVALFLVALAVVIIIITKSSTEV